MVTGAAGFIGFHVSSYLSSDKNNEVFLVDNFLRRSKDASYAELASKSNVTEMNLDLIKDSGRLPDVDYVIHLASLNGTNNFYERPFDVIESATLTTFALLRRYRNTQLKNFLLSSTSEVYAGATDLFSWPLPTNEAVPLVVSDVLEPRWSYAAGKIAAEAACNSANIQFGIPCQIIRYHNVYGPRMGNSHFIPQFIRRCLDGDVTLNGFENTRSFIYVTDAVEATIKVLHSHEARTSITHIGNEEEVSILEVGKLICRFLGLDIETAKFNSAPSGSVSRRCPDVSKLKKLGFSPKVTIEEGLKNTISYYRNSEM